MSIDAGKLAFALGELRLPDGRLLGDAVANDQWLVRDVLMPCFATGDNGLPRYSLAYLELSRGHAKSTGAAAVGVTEAALIDGTDVVIAAGDTDQARIVLEHVDGFISRSDRLAGLVNRKGDERQLPGGSRIRVISSDAPTAWGLGGTHRRFRVVCDELVTWRGQALWEALVSATGKTRDAQTVILSNAGFDEGTGWQWGVRKTAASADWAYLYSTPGIVASWITPEWVEQMRELLPPTSFGRVILNRWSSGAGDFISREQWRECVDHALVPQRQGRGLRYFAGLDLGLVKDATALAVMHRDGDLTVLDELHVWQGTHREPVSIAAVERAVEDAAQRYHGIRIACDPWQLKGTLERLAGRVRVEPFNFTSGSVQRISQALYQAVTSAQLRVYPDAELEREILGLVVRESAGGWRFDHRAGGFSDRAVALSMAVLLCREQRVGGRMRVASTHSGRRPAPGRRLVSDSDLANRLGVRDDRRRRPL